MFGSLAWGFWIDELFVVLDFIEIVASELVGGWKGNKVFDEDYCWREGGYLHCCQCIGSLGAKCGSLND